ncbi:DUF4083 family protein [Paenibacillus qinlingensis]
MQLISLLLIVLLIVALVSAIRYMRWKKKSDIEIGRKLETVIELLGKDRS